MRHWCTPYIGRQESCNRRWGDWIKREFDTTETVEWVWTVRADRAGAAQVRLDFRPAVEVLHGGRVVPGNEDSGILTETYTSNITVDTAVLDAADDWFKNDFQRLAGLPLSLARPSLRWLRGSESYCG